MSLGYSPDALPADYLDKPPSDLSLAKKNLDLLVNMIRIPTAGESSDLWNRLEDFLDETTQEVYVTLTRLLTSIEFVLSMNFEEHGTHLDAICVFL